jgi:pyruvate,water dikinase
MSSDNAMARSGHMVVRIGPDTAPDVAALGGKGSGLAFLAAQGVGIPPAFVITADGFRAAVGDTLLCEVADRLGAIASDADGAELEERTAEIRSLMLDHTAGHALTAQIAAALEELAVRTGDPDLCVAVRSSSIAEDGAEKSFAGEHDTYLWVQGAEEVDRRVRECWASLATARAVSYRQGAVDGLAMAVVVQQMAPARAAGVMMTLNPVNGDRSKVMIESVWGLGEPLVSGEATPDRFLIDKITGEIVRREVAHKETRAVRDPASGRGVVLVDVPDLEREAPSLDAVEIAELVRIGRLLERAAGGPQDAEFAVVPGEGPDTVRLLQCRPETVWSNRPRAAISTPGRSAMDAVLATLTQNAPR